MVIQRSRSMNLRTFLTAAWDWSKKWDLPINPTKFSYLTIGARLSFFSDGSGTSIAVSTLVKDLGVQTDNMFSPSAQCTEAANKARRLIFMIRLSFQDLSTSAFIPLYGALVRPHLQYGVSACCRYQPSRANSKISYTGMRYLPYEERLQRLGLHSLQRRRLRDELITAFKIFNGLLDIEPNLFFFPPAGRGLKGHPFKVLQGTRHHRRRGSAFSVRVVKYWNKLPSLQLLLSMFSRNG